MFDEHAASPRQGPERLGLPRTAILRQRQDRPPTLTQRFGVDEHRRFGRHGPVFTGSQTDIQPTLLRRPSELVEARRLGSPRVPPVEIVQRSPPPHRQRTRIARHCTIQLTRRGQEVAPVDEPDEFVGIEVVAGNRQPIATGSRLDRACPDRLPQPGHTDLHLLDPRLRRLVSPHHVGDLLGPHNLAATYREHAENDAVARLERVYAVDLQRPEQADAHDVILNGQHAAVNGRDTAGIPLTS